MLAIKLLKRAGIAAAHFSQQGQVLGLVGQGHDERFQPFTEK